MSEPSQFGGDALRLQSLDSDFSARYGRSPVYVAQAPGRVNLIGEHTDYNEGFVLPVAIDRLALVAVAPSSGPQSRVWSANMDAEASFDAGQIDRDWGSPWSNYVRGCAWALAMAGHPVGAVDMTIESNVPLGSGLSSSAALEVATVAALAGIRDAGLSTLEIARLAHRAETEFVGVPCGIMDQFASALGVEGAAILIDCRSEEVEAVRLGFEDHGLSIVVVESGISRQLTESAYHDRREECREACRLLRGPLSRPVASLRDVSLEELALVGDQIPRVLLKRALHVVSENGRVLDFVAAVRSGRIDELGPLMAESHRSLRNDYEVSVPEIDLLVGLADAEPEVIGARLTGAGFGGCTVNLVRAGGIERFRRNVLEEYVRKTGRRAEMHICRASSGVRVTRV